MAIIGKIQKNSILLLIVIGGAMLAFIFTDFFSGGGGGEERIPTATVYGDEIDEEEDQPDPRLDETAEILQDLILIDDGQKTAYVKQRKNIKQRDN